MEAEGAEPGFAFYLGLRARYLRDAGKTLLLQRWLIVIGAFLASPSLPVVAILLHLGHLALSVLAGPDGLQAHLIGLLAAQVLFIAWSEGLRSVVRGGAFRLFLDSLPITPQIRLLIAGALLAVLDLPLFLPFVIGGVLIGSGSLLALSLYIMRGVVFAGLILLVQAAIVERLFVLLVALVLADCLLAAGCVTQPFWAGVLCLGGAGALGAAGFMLAGREPGTATFSAWLSARRRSPRRIRVRHVDRLARLSPVMRLQLRSCLEPGSGVGSVLVIALLLPVGLWVLLSVFAFDGRSVPVMIVGMSLVALFSLAPFVVLDNAHRQARSFMATLPLPRLFWPVSDFRLVLAAFAPSVLLFVLPLCLHALISPLALAIILLSYVLLLAGMRLSVRVDLRWRAMASIALSILWASFILMEVTA